MVNKFLVKRIFLAALLAAIILFVWSAISWTVLTWHQGEINLYNTMNAFSTQRQDNSTTNIQIDISSNNVVGKAKITRNKAVQTSMTLPLFSQFIVQYIAAWLVALMLTTAWLPRYWHRVGFVVLFGLAAGIICYLPHCIWFRIPIRYTFVNLSDSVIGWFLAGLGLAWLIKGHSQTTLS